MNWIQLSEQIANGVAAGRDEGMAVLRSPDDELLQVLDGAYRLRRHYWGNRVRVHVLQNAKSGMCRENCAFCSQAMGAYSGVDRYYMQSVDEILAGAREAKRNQAVKYCIVTATRSPSEKELETVCEATRRIKAEMEIEICTSLGLLNDEQAEQLASAGVDRFNNNLETSQRYFGEICQTHTWEDRVNTVRTAQRAGLEACCGGIMGMGETDEDRVELALALRELDVESVPVNFLDPRPGTPLADRPRMAPRDALRCLAMFRYLYPSTEIRIAGGREVILRHLQPLALYPANSLFTEGYLTTGGQGSNRDFEMIEEAGFEVEELSAEPAVEA